MNRPAKPLQLEQAHQLGVEALTGDLVDGAERLVEQEHRRVERERAGQRRAHLHATRERQRVVLLEALQPDQLDRLGRRRGAAPALATPCSSQNSSTLRCTVRHGSSVASWKT